MISNFSYSQKFLSCFTFLILVSTLAISEIDVACDIRFLLNFPKKEIIQMKQSFEQKKNTFDKTMRDPEAEMYTKTKISVNP